MWNVKLFLTFAAQIKNNGAAMAAQNINYTRYARKSGNSREPGKGKDY